MSIFPFYVQKIKDSTIYQVNSLSDGVKLNREIQDFSENELHEIIDLKIKSITESPSVMVAAGYVTVPESDFKDRMEALEEFNKRQNNLNN